MSAITCIHHLTLSKLYPRIGEAEIMTIVFQISLAALVILSFVLVVGMPVALATPQNWDQSKRLIFLGSAVWTALVLLVGGLNYLVV